MRALPIFAAASFCALSACATLSPVSRIETQLVSLGVSEARAECLAEEIAEDLDRDDLNDVADFLEGLNRAQSPGGAIDALLRIDNADAAAAIAAAAISCAIG